MTKDELLELGGGNLVQVANDGKTRAGQVGQYRAMASTGNAAVLINGKMAYIAPKRLSRYVRQ